MLSWEHSSLKCGPEGSEPRGVSGRVRLIHWYKNRFFLYLVPSSGAMNHYHRLLFLWRLPAGVSSPTHQRSVITRIPFVAISHKHFVRVLSSTVNTHLCTYLMTKGCWKSQAEPVGRKSRQLLCNGRDTNKVNVTFANLIINICICEYIDLQKCLLLF